MMTDADTVADLMTMADEYACLMCAYEYWAAQSKLIAEERKVNCNAKRSALKSAIRAALAEARRDAIQDAAQVVNEWYAPVGIAEALSMKRSITSAIRALIDKKD